MANKKKHTGAAMIELALTLPLMMLLIGAIVEFSLLVFTWANGIEATRAGVRYAAVSNPVTDLSGLVCDGDTTVNIEADCDSADCDALLEEMQKILPEITAENVHVVYECSRTGNPDRPGDIKTPEIRISIRNFSYQFLFPQILSQDNLSITMPEFTSTHTAEDLHNP